MAAKSKTAKYYQNSEKGRKTHQEYQKEYNKKPREVSKRTALNRENRKRGTYGNGDGKDISHTRSGLIMKPQSVNRGSREDMPGDKRARG